MGYNWREWLQNIVVVMVLATFLDLILPSGKLRSYTRLVVSLVILLILLQPVVEIIRGADSVLLDLGIYQAWVDQEQYRMDTRVLALRQDDLVIMVYKEHLKAQMSHDILHLTNNSNFDLLLEVNTAQDSREFGVPQQVVVVFHQFDQEETATTVAPVIVDVGQTPPKSLLTSGVTPQEQALAAQISTILHSKYGVAKYNVEIKFQR